MFGHYIAHSPSSHNLVDIWGHQFTAKFIMILLLDILLQYIHTYSVKGARRWEGLQLSFVSVTCSTMRGTCQASAAELVQITVHSFPPMHPNKML